VSDGDSVLTDAVTAGDEPVLLAKTLPAASLSLSPRTGSRRGPTPSNGLKAAFWFSMTRFSTAG